MTLALLRKSWHLLRFSRGRYLRTSMLPPADGLFYLKGQPRKISGQHYSSLLSELVFRDVYQLKKLRREPINTIVDVGANIGIFSLWAALNFPHARVFSFEPNPQLVDVFRKNLTGIDTCEFLPMALAASDGTAWLDVSGSHTESHLVSQNEGFSADCIACDVMGLGTLQRRIQRPIDLLKLDCEGAEYAILFGSDLSAISFIVGELHTTDIHTPADALTYLQQAGFRVSYTPQPNGREGIFLARRAGV